MHTHAQAHTHTRKRAHSRARVHTHARVIAIILNTVISSVEELGVFSNKGWDALNHTILSTSNCGNPALRCFGFG